MRLIAISKLRKSALKYPDVAIQIDDFYEIIKKAQWHNLEEVKQTFSSQKPLVILQLSILKVINIV